jgi:hypothetical protein
MQPNAIKIICILLEMKAGIHELLSNRYKGPALLNIYAFIDICASISAESKMRNRVLFKTYLEKYVKPWSSELSYSDLWAARSSIVHSLSPFGHLTIAENATPIFYYSWPEKKEEIELIIRSRGYDKFSLVNVIEIHSIAIEAFNNFHKRIEGDIEFEKTVITNATHILANADYYQLEEILTLMKKVNELAPK